ncbi:MAG: cell division protein FtsK, partial [Acidimicrobiales bacterium]|nr:cell division protein FtsK [Acidimicrobiales bacterium]
LDEMRHDLEDLANKEVVVRCEEVPSTKEVLDAVSHLTELMWTRRQSEREYLRLRLGLGTLESRTEIEVPDSVSKREEGYEDIFKLISDFTFIDNVPIIADLTVSPSIGVAASDQAGDDIVRSLLLQLCGLHSPAEVVLVCLAPLEKNVDYDWLKWLPHASSPSSPIEVSHLAFGQASCLDLIASLEDLIEQRVSEKDNKGKVNVDIVALILNDAPVERSRIVQLSERGLAANVHIIWRSPTLSQLPASCRTYIELDSTSPNPKAVFVDQGRTINLVNYERSELDSAKDFAQRLAPVYDSGAKVDDESDLPASVSFVSLVGSKLATSPEQVIERWRESNSITDRSGNAPQRRHKDNSLRALVGQSATDAFYIDLRTQGPHALVGGTTGAGKSEFLQSWIMGMSLAHSPDRVTFLLVDYKGGSAFGDCAKLPHTVGMVTDLSEHLARRALVSLVAELRYREHILNRKKAKDLLELERRGDPQCPPSLVIVIDEFAALVSELPEFVDGVVNVAQRGRSLGLHLILATQRPAGVIKDNLRANTNLRVALRMADEADSTDVLGVPIAASFDPSIPGRGAAKLGPGRLVNFQAAYVGGHTAIVPPPPKILIEELKAGQGRIWEEVEDFQAPEATLGPNDIKRLVSTISTASNTAGIENPRKPWLPELAPIYELGLLETKRLDSELVFAVSDLPESQDQPTAAFYPDLDGNMIIYGTGGSGKSTTLRTLAISAGFGIRGGPCHVYGLDFGSRGLTVLEDLPHVGSIIGGDDIERTVRLLREIRSEIDARALRYAKSQAATLSEYRKLADKADEPRIIILIDGIQGFRQVYEGTDKQKWFDVLLSIATDGRPVGVHLLVTGDRPAALPSSLASTMQRKLVLRMASENDLGMLGVPLDGFASESPPGRGYLDGCEIQVAVLGGTANLSEQSVEVKRLSVAMEKAGVSKAPEIGRLSDQIRLSELVSETKGEPIVGVFEESLLPAAMPTSGTFLLSGPPGSGRTTCLATLAQAVKNWNHQAKLVY